MGGGRLLLTAGVALAALGLHTAGALAARPQFVSVAVRPAVLQAGGGTFEVSARVRDARTCRVDAGPLVRRRLVNCSSGHIAVSGRVPPNTTTNPALWSVAVEAVGGSHTDHSREVKIEVLPREQESSSPPPPPPAGGVDVCAPGPECDYGASSESFQTWGNVAPEPLGDCAFAAVADWEQIVLQKDADPTLIGYEYAKAGGTENGLAQNALWSYWRSNGIAGVHLTGLHSYTTTVADVENGVRDYRATIAELSFEAGWGFGPYTMAASLHDVVVDGFTPEGPLVVTWGETVQMTWEQWRDEVVGMWGAEAS